jgi:hypothetical protein
MTGDGIEVGSFEPEEDLTEEGKNVASTTGTCRRLGGRQTKYGPVERRHIMSLAPNGDCPQYAAKPIRRIPSRENG